MERVLEVVNKRNIWLKNSSTKEQTVLPASSLEWIGQNRIRKDLYIYIFEVISKELTISAMEIRAGLQSNWTKPYEKIFLSKFLLDSKFNTRVSNVHCSKFRTPVFHDMATMTEEKESDLDKERNLDNYNNVQLNRQNISGTLLMN